MKKALLFAFAILFAVATMAQNRATILQESFNGNSIPSGWSVAEMGTSNWSVVSSQNAGGNPNELKLYYDPSFNGTSRFVSPAVDLTGVSSVIFSFKHCLDNYSGSHTLGIATSSDGGTTWNVGWSQAYSSDGVWTVTQEITTPDMGSNNVHFCIFYTGNSYNIDNWYFDDILVFTLEELDLGIDACNIPSFLPSGAFGVEMTVKNYGATTITSVEATYTVEGKAPVTETFNVNIPSLGSTTLQFNENTVFTPGFYTIDFSIDKVNGEDDVFTDNNTLSASVSAALTSTQKIPMIEHFSSSTCGPCVSVNTTMLNFCNNNPGRFTYTKYQMNWPGNGDPYYTAEGGTRRTYYGVSAVPQCFLDGEDQGYAAVQATVFNQHADRDAFVDVRGSFSVEGNNIHVLADIMPYIDVTARVYVSVNEKETHNNVGGNGETSFHHIFMKMLPNAQGTNATFVANEMQQFEFTQDMSGTHVEEMSDLEVSIWVQVYNTHEVLNSHFAYEYTNEHPYPVENLSMVKSKGKDFTMTASWDAPANANPIGYDVYLNGQKVLEGTTETSYSFIGAEDDYYVIGVTALYAEDKTSVMSAVGQPDEAFDLGLVPTSTDIMLDPENASAEVRVTNANDLTQTAIVINSIEEMNEEGRQYLTITCADLPLTLNYAEDFSFIVEPYLEGVTKSVAETTVVLSSDAGEVTFAVKVDGELLSVTELSAETKLYPNPTTGSFTVEGVNLAKVEVYNLAGQKVYEQNGSKVVCINAANWNKGIYLVNVTSTNDAVETSKLVVK